MLSGTSSAEDFDGIEKMARHEVEAEAQKWWMDQKFPGGYLPGSYSDVRQTFCLNYDKQPDTYHARMLDLGRRRRKKTKNQPQHWPSCHCPLDATKTSTGRTKYCKNVEAVLSAYECWLENPESQTLRKSQSNLQSTRFPACSHGPTVDNVHQLRKRQPSTQRRQSRNEEEQIMLPMTANASNFDESDHCDACYECLQSMKNRWRDRAPWRDEQIMTGVMKRVGVDRDTAERFAQNKREQTMRQESPPSRQYVENSNKQKALEKCESEEHDHDHEDFCHARGALRSHPGRHEDAKKMDPKNVADERKEQGNGAFHHFYTTKGCGLLKSSKSKNDEELHKILSTNDANDHPKDGHLQDETENRSACKPCKRSTVRLDSSCRPDEESPVNREKASEDTYCELSSKNEDQGTNLHRKNIYASGDLDLHAHKSDMIGLIERVIGNKFGTGQQKSGETNEAVVDKGIYAEIMRDLQADGPQQTRNETGTACINQLKLLRWEQMKHIQNEFSRLCTLQKILDNYSPRQSVTSSFESHSNAVETRTEER